MMAGMKIRISTVRRDFCKSHISRKYLYAHDNFLILPGLAQLVERRTVEGETGKKTAVIRRSLVRIRKPGFIIL